MASYKHIDTDLIDEIAQGSHELVCDLIDIFIRQAPMFSEQLDDLFNNKDYMALGKLAHKIKGSVSTVGISKLVSNMKDLETLAKQGIMVEKYPKLINSYKTISEEAIKELENLRNRLKTDEL